jgi:hypothetical protein
VLDGDRIIPDLNIQKRHENLFEMKEIDPIVLQDTRMKNLSFAI